MDLRITTQSAQIGINTTQGRYDMSQNQWPMRLRTTEPVLHLQSEDAILYIDQRRCFSEAGLKSSMELSQKYAMKGKQAALRAIARIADEGREMAAIQHKGSAIARIAKRKSRTFSEQRFNVGVVPKSRPEITVIQGEVKGSLQTGSVDVSVHNSRPSIHYQRGDVAIYIKQKNYINIDYVGKGINVLGG